MAHSHCTALGMGTGTTGWVKNYVHTGTGTGTGNGPGVQWVAYLFPHSCSRCKVGIKPGCTLALLTLYDHGTGKLRDFRQIP